MIFKDRQDAGRWLAKNLTTYANEANVMVLGIPRGGVPVAFEIAMALRAPLDVFLSRKLGVPGQEELAFGAVAAGDGRFLDQEIIQAAGISAEQIERITQATWAKLDERARLYRGQQPPISVEGRTVILVDDGIATGASIYAAIHALRQMNPKKLVVAVPVAPNSTCNWLRSSVDELVVAHAPQHFYAVGQFYDHFSQTTDEEVVALLGRAARENGTGMVRSPGSDSDAAMTN
jgi:putative phosphoribosyl transferase